MEMASGDQCAPIEVNSLSVKRQTRHNVASTHLKKDSKIDDEFELENIIINKTSLTSTSNLLAITSNLSLEKLIRIFGHAIRNIWKFTETSFQSEEDKHQSQALHQLL